MERCRWAFPLASEERGEVGGRAKVVDIDLVGDQVPQRYDGKRMADGVLVEGATNVPPRQNIDIGKSA